MPVHTHIQNAHFHGGQFGGVFLQSGSGGPGANITSGGGGYITGSTATSIATNQNAGSGGSHNNIQPSIAEHSIVRAL